MSAPHEASGRGSGDTVDRCVCTGVTFAELLRIHRSTGQDLEQIAQETGITRVCALCYAYCARTLRTGQTVHPLTQSAASRRR